MAENYIKFMKATANKLKKKPKPPVTWRSPLLSYEDKSYICIDKVRNSIWYTKDGMQSMKKYYNDRIINRFNDDEDIENNDKDIENAKKHSSIGKDTLENSKKNSSIGKDTRIAVAHVVAAKSLKEEVSVDEAYKGVQKKMRMENILKVVEHKHNREAKQDILERAEQLKHQNVTDHQYWEKDDDNDKEEGAIQDIQERAVKLKDQKVIDDDDDSDPDDSKDDFFNAVEETEAKVDAAAATASSVALLPVQKTLPSVPASTSVSASDPGAGTGSAIGEMHTNRSDSVNNNNINNSNNSKVNSDEKQFQQLRSSNNNKNKSANLKNQPPSHSSASAPASASESTSVLSRSSASASVSVSASTSISISSVVNVVDGKENTRTQTNSNNNNKKKNGSSSHSNHGSELKRNKSIVDYDVLHDLLDVLPKIIDANNIEDNTTNDVDRETLKKQSKLVDNMITALTLMMSNLPSGKVLIDRLTDDNDFSKLFCKDRGNGGYRSKILKNKVACGVFFSLCQFRRYYTNMEDEDMNKLIKLLQKLSSKIDDKKFGLVGGLSEVNYLLQSTKNKDYHKSLYSILNDMYEAQQYNRVRTAA